jgi:hypothetical protein
MSFMKYYDEENEPILVTCNGCHKQEQVDNWDQAKYHEWHRNDVYGLSTGVWCDDCYENHYPYRKDKYFDPDYCGERMDDDY